jgi:arsenate reductase
MITVLFACVHNAGRSQIAAALFNKYADPGKAVAISAGTQPASRVHPEVSEAMRSRGIDLTYRAPQKLTAELASTADWLITMGCGDECPVVPGAQRDDWPIQDPKGQSEGTIDGIIADIDARVTKLIQLIA